MFLFQDRVPSVLASGVALLGWIIMILYIPHNAFKICKLYSHSGSILWTQITIFFFPFFFFITETIFYLIMNLKFMSQCEKKMLKL